MELVGRQKVGSGSRIICEAGNGGVLTSTGRQGDVGKREAELAIG